MLVPWADLNGHHPNTAQCNKVEERKRRRLVEEDFRSGTERNFREYIHPLTMVKAFKYLGRILSALEDNWQEMVDNLSKAWNKWDFISRIMGKEGEYLQTPGNFFKAMV